MPPARKGLANAAEQLRANGARIAEINIEPFLQVGKLLYGGALVAERYRAIGPFIAHHRESVEPSVAAIVLEAQSITADTYREDLHRLEHYRQAVNETMRQFDALLVPTVPYQPTIQQVQQNPLEVNNHLGTYTTFCNLLDMCAVVLPAHEDAPQLGATLLGSAFHDALIGNIAERITDPGQR